MNTIKRLVLGLAVAGCLLSLSFPSGGRSAVQTVVFHSRYAILANDDSWKWSPAAAYAAPHDEYLVVWETWFPDGHHAIFGRRVSASGQPYPLFTVFDDVYNSLQPSVAYDSAHDRYLVAWAYDSAGDGLDNDIFLRFIPWSGPSDDFPAFALENSRANTTKPRIAYAAAPDEFMVVWKVEADPAYIAGGLWFNQSQTAKAVAVSSGLEVRDFPDVAYNQANNTFTTAWDVDMGRGNMDLDIYALRLSASGAALGSGEFPVATLASNEQHVTVASCYGSGETLFAWQQQVNPTSSDDNIFGRLMDASGALAQSYGLAGTTLPQRYPRLACNPAGNQFLLVWQDQYAKPLLRWGVWGELINPGLAVEPAFDVVGPSDERDRLYPALAFGSGKALVTWQHGRDNSGYLDIWAQALWMNPYRVFAPLLSR